MRLLRFSFILGSILGLTSFTALSAFLFYLNGQLPQVQVLEDPSYSLPTVIYDRHGNPIEQIFVKRRKLVRYEQLPTHLIQALIAKEDSHFFLHHGIDPLRMLKAAWINMLAMDTAQGASTLTQQTARQFFLSLEKTWVRKIKEILLALRIERDFQKEEILTLYLNKVNFGDAWGVSAAAEYYFGKNVESLSLAESALLVGLLPAPNLYKPTRNPHLARTQRNIVLQRMLVEGFILDLQRRAASAEPIILATRQNEAEEAVNYYVEFVRRKLLSLFGTQQLYEGGMHVYTTMDLHYQRKAHQALREGLEQIDRRQGWRGAEEQIELDVLSELSSEMLFDLNLNRVVQEGSILRGVIVEADEAQARVLLSLGQEGVLRWETLKEEWSWRILPAEENDSSAQEHRRVPVGSLKQLVQVGDLVDVRVQTLHPEGPLELQLHQEPRVNGGVYVVDPHNGEVLALVGGVRFGRGVGESEFIRATQAKRQPGSAFKPIVYAAALDEGYTPATVLEDVPRTFVLENGRKHIPHNYDQRFFGKIPLRESLVRSRNVPTVQLVQEIGARKVIRYARKLGFTTAIPEETLIALGTHSVKLSELTHAYSVFASGGKLNPPVYIRRIRGPKGNILLENNTEGHRVISESTAYLITDILQDVVRKPSGTAYRVMKGFGRPIAGKTGTTQNYVDAWYVGFTPQVVSGVYVGMDDPTQSLGPYETGSRSAAPIWRRFMEPIVETLPTDTFAQPRTIIAHRVDREGRLLDPCDQRSGSRYELFKAETLPSTPATQDCSRPSFRGSSESYIEVSGEDAEL